MSRTIITKNNIDFFTNLNSEQLIGQLCKESGAKYHDYNHYIRVHLNDSNYGLDFENISFPYKMNNEECIDTATKLRTLLDKSEELFPKYKLYFEKGSTSKDLKEFLVYYSDIFEKCGGYECLG